MASTMGAKSVADDAPLPVRTVEASSPLDWLAAGWRDFARSPLAGLVHGGFVAVGGWAVVLVSFRYGWLAPGAFSGFVILGPILVTGLYEISRLHARGQRAGLRDAVAAWRRGTAPLVWLGLLLAALGTMWVLVSALLFSLFAPAPLRGPLEFLRYAFIEQGELLFTAVGRPRRHGSGRRLRRDRRVAAAAARPAGRASVRPC